MTCRKPKWLFWLIFATAAVYCFSSLFTTMQDYDVWFHIRAGEEVLRSMAVPKTAVGSWYGIQEGLPLIAHEWLFGVMVYLLDKMAGHIGLAALPACMITLIMLLILLWKKEEAVRSPLNALAVVAIYGTVMHLGDAPRPQLFQYMMIAMLMFMLEKEENNPSKRIWLLVPLTVLWANVHGGSWILVPIFFISFILLHQFEFDIGGFHFQMVSRQLTYRWSLVLLFVIAAAVVNPNGVKMLIYPFQNAGDKVMLTAIIEWHSPDFNDKGAIAYMIALAYPLFAVFLSQHKPAPWKMCILLMTGYLALKGVRFIPVYVVAGSIIALDSAPQLPVLKASHRILASGMLFLGLLGLSIIALVIQIPMTCARPFDTSDFPSEQLVEATKELAPHKLYNTYESGGYLIYEHVEVFIDGRADIYSKYNLTDWLSLDEDVTKVGGLIDKYGFDAMLVKRGGITDFYLSDVDSKGFTIAAEDEDFILYAK